MDKRGLLNFIVFVLFIIAVGGLTYHYGFSGSKTEKNESSGNAGNATGVLNQSNATLINQTNVSIGINQSVNQSNQSQGNQSNYTGELPDLIISSFNYSYTEFTTTNNITNDSDTYYDISLVVIIKNIGGSNASSSTIRLVLSPIGTQNWVPSALIPGGTQTITGVFTNLSARNYVGTANADWNEVVQESNEENNVARISFVVS